MKKLAATLSLAFLTTFATAGIPDRIFEVGTDLEVGIGNSYFAFGDFFKETLVLDLNKMASTLSNDGLAFSFDGRVKEFMNLNLSPEFRLGLFFQTNSSGYSSVPKSFFELAAKGNALDQTYSGTLKMRSDVTAEMGASFGTQLFGFGLKVGTSYFIPLVHLEQPKATYSWRTNSDGTMVADVVADLPVYSVIPLDNGVDGGKVMSNLFKAGGLDFSVGLEYPLFPDLLLVGGELKNIPLWPAKLEERTRFQSTFSFSMADVANNYSDQSKLYKTTNSSSFKSDKNSILVLRPFKVGTYATYLPFGSPIVSLTPNLGLGVYGWVYPEFGVKAQLDVWRWLVFNLATQYEDQLWKQKVGLNINLWLLELDVGVTSQSQDIAKSFGGGLSAAVGFRMGF